MLRENNLRLSANQFFRSTTRPGRFLSFVEMSSCLSSLTEKIAYGLLPDEPLT